MPEQDNNIQQQFDIVNKIVKLENDKLEIRRSHEKMAIENADKKMQEIMK